MSTVTISSDLRAVMRRLKLSRILDTLPERLVFARQQQTPHQDFLLLVLQDEATRRDSLSAITRAQRAQLDPTHQIENWDETAKVTFDRQLLAELLTLRLLDSHHHVSIVGPVGVGKTFLAHAIGHAACRRGHSVLAVRSDRMLKTLKQARLINAYETELRRLVSVDLLILDDFGLDAMDQQESRDAYEIFTERHRAGSMIVTSNRTAEEWLPTFADPVRAQSAIDRFDNAAYDLVIEGESYRGRQKPGKANTARGGGQ
jgi:DNA replication protein DnaC